ncbi:M48 family metallopeptidase [Blastococcus sp. KM273129]|uniref:tetratricopeptide repeat protein n=1 Tax=Blastococcus sp. KM273129 TaxID=2570315 RepID=UPI001F340A90|nr:hypothetical protein [Blastococcus sp. KM273129]
MAVVREAVGVAAYHAGDYAEAAREIRAYRRMSGDQGYRAVLADCERALGRPEVAIRLVNEALADVADEEETVELRLVEAGARQDLGEGAAARLVLERALGGRPDPSRLGPDDPGQLRLAAAYAELLRTQGEDERATQWLEVLAAIDPELVGEDPGIEFSEVDETAAPGDELADVPQGDVSDDEVAGGALSDDDVPLGDVSDDEVAGGASSDDRIPEDQVSGGAPPVVQFSDAELGEEELPDAGLSAHALTGGAGERTRAMTFAEEVEAEVAELLGETDDEASSPADPSRSTRDEPEA